MVLRERINRAAPENVHFTLVSIEQMCARFNGKFNILYKNPTRVSLTGGGACTRDLYFSCAIFAFFFGVVGVQDERQKNVERFPIELLY